MVGHGNLVGSAAGPAPSTRRESLYAIQLAWYGRKVVLAGSVKWSSTAGRAELQRLREAVEALPNRAEHVQLVLFARERVCDVESTEALTFTAADLYDG